MKLKTLLKQKILLIAFIGFIFSPFFVFYFSQHSFNIPVNEQTQSGSALLLREQVVENLAASPKQEDARYGLPIRLKIPKIKVDAAVEYVGRTPEGAMDVPKNQENVAWFELGQRPGENGTAAIAGHYGRKNNRASAFDTLYKLRKGDKIYVEDDKGEVITFVVRESRRYDPDADASDVFGSNDGRSHLNLITCEGAWDEASQSYSHRLVIFTDKEVE